MKIPDDIRKCVLFIGYKSSEKEYSMLGSGFLFGFNLNVPQFVVTAKHIIDKIKSKNLVHVCFRINNSEGQSEWVETNIEQWRSHKTDSQVDVSFLPTQFKSGLDLLALPSSYGITNEKIEKDNIGLGDEVFITGLFRHHFGNKKNIPIVRVGNISSLHEEKIVVRKGVEIDAYLIEARSIGGLSGSPVFVNLGLIRPKDGLPFRVSDHPNNVVFLGLIHGHFDVKNTEVDANTTIDDGLSLSQINTGMAIVVPYHVIVDTIKSNYTEGQIKFD